MTAGTFQVDSQDPDEIQAVIAANATTASRITLMSKFKDKTIIVIHQTS